MYNEANAKLYEIKTGLIRYIEANGGEWVDHGTDDRDRVCFVYKAEMVGVSLQSLDIEGRRVTFGAFMAHITRK